MSNDSFISLEVSIAYSHTTCHRKTQGNHVSIASLGKYGVHCTVTLVIYVLSSAVGQPVNHTP